MTKRYLLVIKNEYLPTNSFYTLEEAKAVAKKDINNYLDKKFEEAKIKTSQTDIDTIWEISDEYMKKALDEVVNNPLWNQLFKNLSKND